MRLAAALLLIAAPAYADSYRPVKHFDDRPKLVSKEGVLTATMKTKHFEAELIYMPLPIGGWLVVEKVNGTVLDSRIVEQVRWWR